MTAILEMLVASRKIKVTRSGEVVLREEELDHHLAEFVPQWTVELGVNCV